MTIFVQSIFKAVSFCLIYYFGSTIYAKKLNCLFNLTIIIYFNYKPIKKIIHKCILKN